MGFNNIFQRISLGESVRATTIGIIPFAVYVSCIGAILGYRDLPVKSGSNFDLMDQRKGVDTKKTALIRSITEYIASQRQPKIDIFEKEAAKRVEQGEDVNATAQERQELEARYLPRNWLTNTAKRAGRIRLVIHDAKFSHGDSKVSSFHLETSANGSYLDTVPLANAATDVIGNVAVLDVTKLLQTDISGDLLLTGLKHGDYRALGTFAEDKAQLELWVAGFSQAWTTRRPSNHKPAKQTYLPVVDGYHLLCPLFSSSLAQAMYEKLTAVCFNEESKVIRDARKAGKWHFQPDIWFPNLAEMHFGSTKPQSIFLFNSVRGSRIWPLSPMPSTWAALDRAPQSACSVLSLRDDFNRVTPGIVAQMTYLLKVNVNNVHIRTVRVRYIDELIDLLLMQTSVFQQEKWQG